MENINDALDYLYSFMNKKNLHKKNNNHISNVENILNILGYKQNFKIIHITGTKGKGSTTLSLAHMLSACNYKTGAFISPHIINERERISINDEWISENDFISIVKKIKNVIEENKLDESITVFEFFTIIGLYYFFINKVDYACIEVGIGGRFDCTNIVNSSISILTSISYDHVDILGNTIEEITYQKAGIIKNNSIVISAMQEKNSIEIIENVSKEKNSTLYTLGKDFYSNIIKNTSEILEFDYIEKENKYHFTTTLLGEHQSENIALSFKAFTLLESKKENIKKAIDSLRNFNIKARLTFIERNPDIIVDGAHNAKSLSRILKTIYKWYDSVVILFAPISEKDVVGMCEVLKENKDIIIISSAKTKYKDSDSFKTYEYLREKENVYHIESFDLAVEEMKKISKEKNIPALVIGSLYSASDYIISQDG